MTIRKTSSSFVALAALAALVVSLGAGCATNPVSGKRQFSLVSSAQEQQMGREGHDAVLKEYGAYEDPRLQAYVDSVGHALAKVSHLPDLDWHFTVIDDPTVNAFALPGGYIYITRGILAHLNSEAQLAGVLGHEIGHVTARHSASRLTQQQVAGLGLGIAGIFSEGFRRYSDLAQTALGLMFLKYSRDDENQADELGIQYSVRAGWDAREVPATYQMLGRIGARSGQRLPTFLSTHPDPGNRESRTATLAAQNVAGKTGLIVRGPAYIRRLDGVTFGIDPRQGYFQGTTFYHPGLRFEMRFPDGWKTQNSREAVIAAEPNNRAQMQLTLANAGSLSPGAFVAELQRGGKILGADGRNETVGGHAAWVGRIEVPGQSGANVVLAAAFIRKSSELMFQVLGQSASPGDANESQILSSARSLRDLDDPARLAARPDRLDVVTVTSGGPFSQVVARFTPLAISVEDASILNNVDPDETVRSGQLLKVVRPGPR